MNILAIDTSCDETAVAVTADLQVVSNIVWSQSSLHSSFGGVFPSLAQRMHQERIEFVVKKALGSKHKNLEGVDAIAVTIGPGLAVALGVGIEKAKELATKHNLPLIPVNHIESHLLSPFCKAVSNNDHLKIDYPALGLVLSGGTTALIKVNSLGSYEMLAETQDDAIGEALDKAARLLGLGYPGGAVLEKFAKLGDPSKYQLPLPLTNDVIKNRFSYSGVKTAFVRLFDSIKNHSKQDIYDLAASFQHTAFLHIEKVLEYQLNSSNLVPSALLFGGGCANNILLKKMLRKVCKKYNIKLHTPYSKKLNGDNAGMIGVCAYLKNKELTKQELINKYSNFEEIDRNPRLSL